MGVSFSEDRGKTILSIGWEDAFKKGGYIRMLTCLMMWSYYSHCCAENRFKYLVFLNFM
jgi:hypothetical protein